MQQHRSDGTKQERTGWRDAALSLRHRDWGFNCPMVDIDFLVIEYNRALPVALVEYKHVYAEQFALNHPTYLALTALCDRYSDGPLPFFIAVYWRDPWAFRVTPVNHTARVWFPETRDMTERGWVLGLYKMRGEPLPRAVRDVLNETPPPRTAA